MVLVFLGCVIFIEALKSSLGDKHLVHNEGIERLAIIIWGRDEESTLGLRMKSETRMKV